MRILYLHQYFTTPERGGGTRSYEFARRLVRAGHEVQLITAGQGSAGSGGWTVSHEEGIEIHWAQVPYDTHMGFLRRLKAFGDYAVRASIRGGQLRPDVVFATSTPLTVALPAVRIARKCKVPLIFEVRDLWPAVPIAMGVIRNPLLKYLANRLERYAYENSERVVVLAPGMVDEVHRTGFPKARVEVIPNGADLDLFDVEASVGTDLRAAYPWLGSRPLVLYAGSVGRINGVEFLVRIAEKMLETDAEVRFVVIGAGNRWQQVKQLAVDLGVLDRNLFMLDSMPKSELVKWVAASTITTALIDGPEILWKHATQNKFYDSLAGGKPVACNFRGYQSIVAEEHRCGIILDSEDITGSTQALATTLRDNRWLASASAAARELARTDYCRDRLADQLREILESSVSRNRGTDA